MYMISDFYLACYIQAAVSIACIGKANLLPMLGWYVESKMEAGVENFRTVFMMDICERR
jgi:hypothetical protein